MCLANGLLFTTILTMKSLRKRNEMILVAGLALADCLFGSGAIYLGLYRVVIWARTHEIELLTYWERTRLPPIFLINIGLQMTALMNLIVGIDRLFAVTWAEKYVAYIGKIIKKLIAFPILFFIVSLGAMLLSSYTDEPPAIPTQVHESGRFRRWYFHFHFIFIVLVEYVSVIVYIRIFILYKKILGNKIKLLYLSHSSPNHPFYWHRICAVF